MIAGLCLSTTLLGQTTEREVEVLTLDDCIQTALDRNIALKRSKNEELIARARQFQSLMNYLPSLSISANYDFFFGTFFDTNAARQISATTNSSNPNVSSNVTIFNGFANHYSRKQAVKAVEAAAYAVEGQELTVESTILGRYLQVILDQENIKISQQRIDLLQTQLDRAVKRESVGVGGMEDVYNFKSQIANEKLNLTQSENTLRRDKLLLLQAMVLDVSEKEYVINPYDAEPDEILLEVESFDELLNDILYKMPSVKSAEASLESSKYQMKAASAARLPRISLFGAIGSNYSSNGALNPETGSFEENATLDQQLRYNEFEYLNFTLNIPIFQNYERTTNYQVAKINFANSELAVKESLVNMTNVVQQVYLDLISAQETYESARENLESLTQSYEFMKKRYETGNTDFVTYLEALNNKNRAEIQLVNARYSIVFRKKILDLYRSM